MIAEAGVNHNGRFSLAKKMIQAAARAGANYIKFQTFDPGALATHKAPKARYQKKTTDPHEGQRKMLEKLWLSRAQFRRLKSECQKRRIGFLSTAFDSESLAFVNQLQPAFHKISSGDLDNVPFLRQAARYSRPVILSTGMGSLREVEAALRILETNGLPRRRVIVLQCHTEYPTQPAEVNLRAMDTMRRLFKARTGFSDHTRGMSIALAAVARGACVLEKHFTLSRKLKGPDHASSLTPLEFGRMVQGIREVEASLGDGIKRPTRRERAMIKTVRKYLVANQPIFKGERFTAKNLTLKRSGGGLPASRWDQWIGRRADRSYLPGESIRP